MRFQGTDTVIATPDLMLAVNAAIRLFKTEPDVHLVERLALAARPGH